MTNPTPREMEEENIYIRLVEAALKAAAELCAPENLLFHPEDWQLRCHLAEGIESLDPAAIVASVILSDSSLQEVTVPNHIPDATKMVDERARFEEWASDPVRSAKLPLDRWQGNDGYIDGRTYTAWFGWQAAKRDTAQSDSDLLIIAHMDGYHKGKCDALTQARELMDVEIDDLRKAHEKFLDGREWFDAHGFARALLSANQGK